MFPCTSMNCSKNEDNKATTTKKTGTKPPPPPPPPPPPFDGEPGPVFIARCLEWWDDRIVPLSKSPSNPSAREPEEVLRVLAVTHGAYIKTLLSALIGTRNYGGKHLLGPRIRFYNTSITVVILEDGGTSGAVTCVANIDHLLLELEQPSTKDNPDLMEGEDEAVKEVEAGAAGGL